MWPNPKKSLLKNSLTENFIFCAVYVIVYCKDIIYSDRYLKLLLWQTCIFENKSTKINMQKMVRICSNRKIVMQFQFEKLCHFLWSKKNYISLFAYMWKTYFGKILRIQMLIYPILSSTISPLLKKKLLLETLSLNCWYF